MNAPTDDTTLPTDPDYQSWIVGNVSDAGFATQTDPAHGATNTAPILAGKFYDYNKSIGIYQCPTDNNAKITAGGGYQRARSYSMGGQMNGVKWNGAAWEAAVDNSQYLIMNTKLTAIRNPGSPNQFVFVEKSQYTIDDGYFAIKYNSPSWQNVPAARHGNGDVLSFADGHAEWWRWYTDIVNATTTDWPAQGGLKDADLTRVWAAMGSQP